MIDEAVGVRYKKYWTDFYLYTMMTVCLQDSLKQRKVSVIKSVI